MITDTQKSKPNLKSTEIDLKNALEVRYWHRVLNVSEHELKHAAYLVGNDLKDIKNFLNKD